MSLWLCQWASCNISVTGYSWIHCLCLSHFFCCCYTHVACLPPAFCFSDDWHLVFVFLGWPSCQFFPSVVFVLCIFVIRSSMYFYFLSVASYKYPYTFCLHFNIADAVVIRWFLLKVLFVSQHCYSIVHDAIAYMYTHCPLY